MQLATLAGALMVLATPALAGGPQTAIDETTKAQVLETIEAYVKGDAQVKEAFLILDRRNGEPLRLAFDHMHAGVEPHEEGYAACVDFKDASGTVYDVDIVIERGSDPLRVVKAFLHKVDGKEVASK
ncbi:MAG TPA: hypothetical protein VGC53_00760 [Vicinamibacteria bacterium]